MSALLTWKEKPFIEVATLQRGFDLPIQDRRDGTVPIFAANGSVGFHDVAKVKGPGVITGRSGTLGKVHFAEEDYWPLNTSLWVKDFHGNDPRWICRLLRWMKLEQFTRGVGVPTLNRNLVHEVKVRVPPLAEQKRIAGMLDAADVLRVKRREALAQLDRLTQSIFLDRFGDPAKNNKKLPTVSLGELGEWRSGGTPSRTKPAYFNGTIPWFSSGELNTTYVTDSAEHITSIALAESAAKIVDKGALMLGMYDTAALKASIAGVDCACNQAIAFATITPTHAQTIYVHSAILVGREHFRRLQRGVRQKNLSLAMIKDIRIPLPALDEQNQYVSQIASLEQLRATQLRALAELDTLFASLQSRAFRGEL